MTSNNNHIEFCINTLPKVSRTFAPTIRMLPKKLNVPVTVAYLLCRIADTIEDESSISSEEKQKLLHHYAHLFSANHPENNKIFFSRVKNIPEHSEDVVLLKNLPRVLAVYHSFSDEVQKRIGKWVVEMSLGMMKYAQSGESRKYQFLKSVKELDEYTYYVAGTVGHMLTSLFEYFSQKITPAVKSKLELFSESFGKGLQMVNIIRDMTADLRRGQSYIPEEILHKYELTRRSIFLEHNSERAQRLFNEMIQMAVDHLDKALSYIINLPKEETRIRLFCLLPFFWAMQTLRIVQTNTLALLEKDKVKISRKLIRIEFLKSLIFIFSNRLTIRHYNKIRRNINTSLVPQI